MNLPAHQNTSSPLNLLGIKISYSAGPDMLPLVTYQTLMLHPHDCFLPYSDEAWKVVSVLFPYYMDLLEGIK